MRLLWSILGMLLLGGAAQAQTPQDAISGCEPVLTVQYRDCQVDHIYACGARGFVLVQIEEGKREGLEETTTDGDTRWFVDLDTKGGIFFPEPGDPLSIKLLRETGREMVAKEGDLDMGARGRFKSLVHMTLRLDKATSEIDGVSGRRGTAALAMEVPEMGATTTRRHEIFLPDALDVILSDETHVDGVPAIPRGIMNVIEPGEPGFLSTQGRYDCGELG